VMSTGEGKPKQVRTAHATRSPPPESLEAAASAPADAILAAAARTKRRGAAQRSRLLLLLPLPRSPRAACTRWPARHLAPSRAISPHLSSSLLSTPARVPRSRARSRAAAAADCRGSAFSLRAAGRPHYGPQAQRRGEVLP
jgi:hypothetical protein